MTFMKWSQKGITIVVTIAMVMGGVGIPIQEAHGEELKAKEIDVDVTISLNEKDIVGELEASDTAISNEIGVGLDTIQENKFETTEEKTNEDVGDNETIDTNEENIEKFEDSEKKLYANSLLNEQTLEDSLEGEISFQLKSKGDAVNIYREKADKDYFYIIESKEVNLVRGVSTVQDLFDCLEYDSRVQFKLNNNSFEMSDILKYKNYTEGGQEDPWINFPRLTTHAPADVPGHNIAEYIYYIKLQRPISNELSSTEAEDKKVDISEAFGKNTIASKFLNDTINPSTTVGQLKSRLVKDPDATWVVNDKNGVEKQEGDYLRSGDTITVNGTKGDRVYELILSYDEMLYSDYYINYVEGFIESSGNNKITKNLTLGELKNNCFYAENATITFLRNGNPIDESQAVQKGDVIKITIQESWNTKTKEFTIKSLPVYLIVFNGNGATGEVPNSIEVIDGDISSALPDIENFEPPEGKTFWGWNSQADGKGDYFKIGDMIENIDKDVTLYAIWKELQEQPAPAENMIGIAPTSVSGADGKIVGTTKDMEYRLSTERTYQDITASEITGLKAGIYYIRYKEKYGYKAGTEKAIEVPQYSSKNSILKESQGTFDKKPDKKQDINISVNWNGNTLTKILYGTIALEKNVDYVEVDNKVIIKKEYLSNQAEGTIILTFYFSEGEQQTYSIKITESKSESGGGSSSGGGGSSSSGGGNAASKEDSKVIIRVNGKEENAGKETHKKEDGKSVVEVDVKSDVIKAKIKQVLKEEDKNAKNVVEVPVADTQSEKARVALTGDIVKELEKEDFMVTVDKNNIQYSIPAKEFTIDSVAKELNIDEDKLQEIEVHIEITNVSDEVLKKYRKVAKVNETK